ncbi:MAG TPA: uridine kinase [Candidatus Hypogeohydataceae bacterium YC41]
MQDKKDTWGIPRPGEISPEGLSGLRPPARLPHGHPIFIGICGGTCSGKTSLATQFYQLLGEERVNIISQDNYYKGWSHLTPEERARINFDNPEALETGLLVEHLSTLRRNQKVSIPQYDFKNHARHPKSQEIVPRAFTIVEGILLFHDPKLRETLDLRIYLDVSFNTMLRRRTERDVRERGRTAESVRNQFLSTVYPMHLEFVEPYKRHAHLVIQEETSLVARAALVTKAAERLIQEITRIQARTPGDKA